MTYKSVYLVPLSNYYHHELYRYLDNLHFISKIMPHYIYQYLHHWERPLWQTCVFIQVVRTYTLKLFLFQKKWKVFVHFQWTWQSAEPPLPMAITNRKKYYWKIASFCFLPSSRTTWHYYEFSIAVPGIMCKSLGR